MQTTLYEKEVAAGERFEFGKNWAKFLSVLDEERIASAVESLATMLEEPLEGKTFIDVGCGSGLFSLAAMKLGAAQVMSIDFDPNSVGCAKELRRRFFEDAPNWRIEEGSALDGEYLRSLGQFDVVYSWGVLHHTGNMWNALNNVVQLVRPGGTLFVSIYNDQGLRSKLWTRVKSFYNKGLPARLLVSAAIIPYWAVGGFLIDVVRLKSPAARYRNYRSCRGMSRVHDWFDWLGGYPFEVAKPEEIFEFYRKRGFELRKIKTCGGNMGCNEFVLTLSSPAR